MSMKPKHPGRVTERAMALLREVVEYGFGNSSGPNMAGRFERAFAERFGVRHAIAMCNGTATLHCCMAAARVKPGDEVIVPPLTSAATAFAVLHQGAVPVFADIDPRTFNIDPESIRERITPLTRAIIPVGLYGLSADMDPIMEIARRHGLRVIEDVSHAHGGVYKGRKLGTIGDVAAMSMMSGKSLAVGEAGMLVTDNREIYERGLAWGHYGRYNDDIQDPWLRQFRGLPLGGHKYRMHQLSSAVGRVQLRHYDERNREILGAMNYFWDLLDGVPGVKAHRPTRDSGSEMGGWYAAHGLYRGEELGGLSITRFSQAVRAEGAVCSAGCNRPLHLHPLFNTCDVYGHGKPTRIANSDRDLRQPPGSLPVSEGIGARVYSIPWFKKNRPEIIREHAAAYRKVAEHADELRADDPGDPPMLGGWHFFTAS